MSAANLNYLSKCCLPAEGPDLDTGLRTRCTHTQMCSVEPNDNILTVKVRNAAQEVGNRWGVACKGRGKKEVERAVKEG